MEMIANLYNTEAEKTVIGCLLYEPELIKDSTLDYLMFHDPRHQNIYYTIKDLDEKGTPVNIVSIVERVGNHKVDKIGGVSYLTELAASIPTTANFNYFEGVIIEHHQKRLAHEVGKRIMQEIGDNEPGHVIQNALDALTSIEEQGKEDDDDGDIRETLVKVYDDMHVDKGDITGIPTGYDEIDRITNGLQKNDLIIIAARPSVGKTAFAINIGTNIAINQSAAVGIFSLEMSKELLSKRMITSVGNIDGVRMRNPMRNFQDNDWSKTGNALGEIGQALVRVFDKPFVNVGYIRKKARMLQRQYPDQEVVIIIDYLQLIQGDPKHRGNRNAEVSEISRSLKGIAMELGITVIALSQLSRGVEQRQDKRPMLSDLRESGSIEQDADIVGFLYRDDYYDKESEKQNIIEIIIAKQRNGPTGVAELAFIKEYGKFVSMESRYQE